MEFLSPKGRPSFPTFILGMDAGSSNFAVDDFNEVMVGLARMDKCVEPMKHIVGFHVGLEFG